MLITCEAFQRVAVSHNRREVGIFSLIDCTWRFQRLHTTSPPLHSRSIRKERLTSEAKSLRSPTAGAAHEKNQFVIYAVPPSCHTFSQPYVRDRCALLPGREESPEMCFDLPNNIPQKPWQPPTPNHPQ